MLKIEHACTAGIAIVLAACGSSAQVDSKAGGFAWKAQSALIANHGVYREHEFVYNDYVYDDHGANTDGRDRFDAPLGTAGPDPNDPSDLRLSPAPLTNWAGDFLYASPDGKYIPTVADLIEFRVAADAQRVYYRFRMGDMTAPDSAVIGICVDEDHDISTGLETWPLGANDTEQLGCDHIYTIWGTGGQVADASGASKTLDEIGAQVSANLDDATISLSVPKTFADPGKGTWRYTVASGVWDAANQAWSAPTPLPTTAGAPVATGGNPQAPNFYDLLSNNGEPNSTWDEEKQANDLTAHHLVDDYLDVDFGRIASGGNDEDPRLTGVVERIYESQYPMSPARGITVDAPNKIYNGAFEPYVAVIPSNYYDDPSRKFAFDFCMHPLGANHNVEVFYAEALSKRDYNPVVTGVFPSTGYMGFAQITALVDRQQIVYACTLGRGEGKGEQGGDGLVDALEVQQDMLERYRIEDAHRTVHGVSLGAIATWYLARLYPDRYSAAMPYIFTPDLTSVADTEPTIENLYNLPVFFSIGTFDQFGQGAQGEATADKMEQNGNEYLYVHYLARQHEGRMEQDFLPFVAKLAYTRERVRDPARVRYQFDPSMFSAKIPGDGSAYWVSGMKPRTDGAAATVDVTDLARADQLPQKQVVFTRLYENPDRLYSTRMRGLFRLSRAEYDALWHPEQWEPGWTEAPGTAQITETDLQPPQVSNAFVLVAANLAEVTLDAGRMKLHGSAWYVVVTDGPTVVHLGGRDLKLPAAGSYEGQL